MAGGSEASRALWHAKIIRDDNPDEAIAAAARAGALFKKAGDNAGMLKAYRAIISGALAKQDVERAAQLAFEKQEAFAAAGDSISEAAMLISVTEVHLAIAHGGPNTGESAESAAAVFKEAKQPLMEAEALVMACRACLLTGDPSEGVVKARRAAMLYQEQGDKEGQAEALLEASKALAQNSVTGLAGQRTGGLTGILQDEALQAAQEAAELSEGPARAQAYLQMASVMLGKFKPAEATRLAKAALRYFKELPSLAGEASVFPVLVNIGIQKGEPQEAMTMLRDKLASYQTDIVKAVDEKKAALATNLIKLQAELSALAMAAYVASADTAAALRVGREVLPVFQSLGDKLGEAATTLRISEVYLNMRLKDEGISWATRAYDLYKSLGNKAGMDAAASVQSILCSERGGDVEKALNRTKALAELEKVKEAAEQRNVEAFKAHLEQVMNLGGTSDQDFSEIVDSISGDKEELLSWMGAMEDIKWSKSPATGLQFIDISLYVAFRWAGMGYGPHFRLLRMVYGRGGATGLDRMGMGILAQHSDLHQAEGQTWENSVLCLHPGLADCALQVGAATGPAHPHYPNKYDGTLTYASG